MAPTSEDSRQIACLAIPSLFILEFSSYHIAKDMLSTKAAIDY